MVDKHGMRSSPTKVNGIMNMPDPRTLKEVQSFIGMVQYYGKFISSLSTKAPPINVKGDGERSKRHLKR